MGCRQVADHPKPHSLAYSSFDRSNKARISSARQAVTLRPSRIGFGKRPVLQPSHQVVFPTGMGPSGAMICFNRTRPVCGNSFPPDKALVSLFKKTTSYALDSRLVLLVSSGNITAWIESQSLKICCSIDVPDSLKCVFNFHLKTMESPLL